MWSFLDEKSNTPLGIGSHINQSMEAGMCVECPEFTVYLKGGELEGGKQGYYNSLGEDIKGGWSRGDRGQLGNAEAK